MLSLWLVLSPASALPPAPKLQARFEAIEPAQREICFPSGMRVHLLQRPGTGLTAASMIIDGGTRAETSEERSAAHLVEHLWFRAKPTQGETVWDHGAGLALDASTWQDFTSYTTIGSAQDLGSLLALEAARLRNPLAGVSAEALAAEKNIIRDELLYRGEHGTRAAYALLDDQLFPDGHPYRGTMATGEDVMALEMSTLESYAKRTYTPAATTLSVESDTDIEALQDAVVEAFGDLLAGTGKACEHPRTTSKPPIPPGAGAITTLEAPIRTQRLYMAWSLPAAWNEEAFLHRLAGRQLEFAIWRRLPWVQGLKGDMREVNGGCNFSPGREASSLTCVVQLPNDVDAKKVAQAALGSLNNQWSFSDGDRARRQRITASIQSATLDATLAYADRMDPGSVEARAMRRHVAGGEDPVNVQLHATLNLNPDQLASIAQTYLTRERAVVVWMKPARFEETIDGKTNLNPRLSAPAIPAWTPARPTIQAKSGTLANGLTVLTSYRGGAPVTRSALVRDGGSLAGKLGVDVAWDYTKAYNVPGVSLSEIRWKTGSASWDATGWDSSSIQARAGGGSADLAMWQTRVWLDTTTVDTKGMQRTLDRALETLPTDLETWPSMQTYTLRAEHLMGDHPTAKPWWDELSAARRVRDTEILKWRKIQENPAHSTLVLVSPNESDARTQATKYLAKWKGKKGDPVPAPTQPPFPTEQKVLALNWDTLVTDVRLSCRIPPRDSKNDAAQDVLVAILQRGTFQTLREDGGTYAPDVTLSTPHRGVAMLHLQAQVPPPQAGATASALLGLLDTASTSISKDLVRWGQLEALGAHAQEHASTLDHFAALESAISSGYTVDEINAYPKRVDAVTAADVQALLQPCAGKEAMTVVGPTPSESLQKAGLSPTPVDWQTEGAARAKKVEQ